MANHPNRSRGPYTVQLFAHHSVFKPVSLASLREARAYAETYGDAAHICTVSDAAGREVAQYRLNQSASPPRWFRAAI